MTLPKHKLAELDYYTHVIKEEEVITKSSWGSTLSHNRPIDTIHLYWKKPWWKIFSYSETYLRFSFIMVRDMESESGTSYRRDEGAHELLNQLNQWASDGKVGEIKMSSYEVSSGDGAASKKKDSTLPVLAT